MPALDAAHLPGDPARRLRDATRRLLLAHGALNDVRRPCGAPLDTAHAYALMELHQRGPLTLAELTRHLGVVRSSLARLTKQMEATGDVERRPHPSDRRARLLSLTAKGQRAAASVDHSSAAHFERVCEELGGEVVEALDRLTAALITASDG